MASTSVIALIGVGLAFASASILGARLFARLRIGGVRARPHDERKDRTWSVAVLRSGVAWALPFARFILKAPRVALVFSEATQLVQAKGYASDPLRLCSVWLAVVLAIMTTGCLLGASPAFGVTAGACCVVVSFFVVERFKDRKKEQMVEGIPDVLRSMGVCFHAGFTLLQTFRQIATETKGPLHDLFLRATHELEIGVSPEEVLAAFRVKEAAPELAFVAVALKVQHDAGGSMTAILEAARDSVQSEIELKRSLKVQTAQAKLSAQVVTAMPFVLIAIFSLFTEDFLAPFFSSPIGLVLLITAIALQVTGVLVVRSMLSVGCD